jgi:dinuclear metal center YbgI/SA1388 family protein
VTKLDDVARVLRGWFPLELAETWDNVGLLLGDSQQPVERILSCLTLTTDVAHEAIDGRFDLIVTYHPILFRKNNRLVAGGPDHAVYLLARAGVAVYSPHTAYDGAPAGINEQIAQRLELQNIAPIRPATRALHYKLVVFVPALDLDPVSSALFAAGAGVIGEYDHCSFRLTGVGTFRGSADSNPTIGQSGRLEEVAEHRLEVLVPADKLATALAAMIEAHSYEEPAYDIYPLHMPQLSAGAGRVGNLAEPVALDHLARQVKHLLVARHVEAVGQPSQFCRRVGIACGAGGDLIQDAFRQGCDVVITGEARFHDTLAVRDRGSALILAGHFATERFAVQTLASRLSQQFPTVTVAASQVESDPAWTIDC